MVGFFFESDCHHDGVRRVIILSIETHPDMMSLSIVYWTGYSWACLGALGRCAALPPAPARRLPPTPPPGARARPISRHTRRLRISPHAHRPTPTAARHSPQSHKDSHYKSPQGSAQMPPPRACKSRTCTHAQSMHLPAISTEYVSSPAPVSHGIA